MLEKVFDILWRLAVTFVFFVVVLPIQLVVICLERDGRSLKDRFLLSINYYGV